MNWQLLYRIALIICVASAASAGEWHLVRDARPQGTLVVLGDLVESSSFTTGEAKLAGLELFPAPAAGQTRLVRRQEVSDQLTRRGYDLRSIRWTGAASVVIHGPGSTTASRLQGSSNYLAVSEVKRQLIDAIARHLDDQLGEQSQWQIELAANATLFRQLQDLRGPIRVTGGATPWVGRHQFQLQTHTSSGPLTAACEANVALPQTILVANRAIARGEVVRADALTKQLANHREVSSQMATSLDQVVGLQARRSIAPGQRMLTSYVQPMRLVKRGDIVTVFARTSGFQIRTKAKALADGSRNDVLELESLLDRKQRFTARVVGDQEVEIFTAGPSPTSYGLRPVPTTPRPVTQPKPVESTRPSVFALEVRPQDPIRR